jgi:hypothetical protein
MANVEDQLKKKPFKKKSYRSYLSLDETLDDVSSTPVPSSSKLEPQIVATTVIEDKDRPLATIVQEAFTKPIIAQETPLAGATPHPIPNMPISEINDLKAEEETYNKNATKLTTVVQQSHNKHATNLKRNSSIKNQTSNKLTAELNTVVQQNSTTNVQQNLKQTPSKLTAAKISSYQSIYGVQALGGQKLRAMMYILDVCIENGSRVSGPVRIKNLANALAESPDKPATERTAQSVIYRLETDGYILREAIKGGRGGWTSYEIPNEIYNQLVQLKTKLTTNINRNLQQAYSKPTSELTPKHTTIDSSKLDSNILNKYNTNLLSNDDLDEVDLSSCAEFGVTKSIIPDIRKNKWDVTKFQLETHIERFAIWAKNPANTEGIKNLRGLFCSNIKRIAETGTDPLDTVKTEAEHLIERMIAKRKEQLETQKKLQEELLNIEFESWLMSKSQSQLRELVPGNSLTEFGSARYKDLVKAYFKDNVWSFELKATTLTAPQGTNP